MDFTRPIEVLIPGVQGRIFGVLVETTEELNLRTVARLADVSVAQAARVLPDLVELGLVERREAPPSALFRLVRENVAARFVLALTDLRQALLTEMGRAADALPMVPVSVIVFGSFARSEADRSSDIDAVFVRPRGVGEDDDEWSASVERWRDVVRRASGNAIEVLEIAIEDVGGRLRARRGVWREIRRDGVVVAGESLAELEAADG